MEKKTPVKQEETKTIENKASNEVKKATTTTKEVKKPEVKAAVEEKAVEVKKETKKEVKKPAAKKTAAKKATTKKEAAQKAEVKPEVYIQFYGHEAMVEHVIERAKKQYEAEGNKVTAIKKLQVYMKPEEGTAYFVINQTYAGKINLF